MGDVLTYSVGPWVIFIGALWFRSLIMKSQRARKASFFFVVPAALTFIAGAAMAEIVIGEWIARAVQGLANMVGDSSGSEGQMWLALLVAGMTIGVIIGLSDFKADKGELRALLLLPTLFVATGGGGISGEGSQLSEAALRLASDGLSFLVT